MSEQIKNIEVETEIDNQAEEECVNGSSKHQYFAQVPEFSFHLLQNPDFRVYATYIKVIGWNGKCFASREYIAGLCKIDVKTLNRAIERLCLPCEELGGIPLIEVRRRTASNGRTMTNQVFLTDIWDLNVAFTRKVIQEAKERKGEGGTMPHREGDKIPPSPLICSEKGRGAQFPPEGGTIPPKEYSSLKKSIDKETTTSGTRAREDAAAASDRKEDLALDLGEDAAVSDVVVSSIEKLKIQEALVNIRFAEIDIVAVMKLNPTFKQVDKAIACLLGSKTPTSNPIGYIIKAIRENWEPEKKVQKEIEKEEQKKIEKSIHEKMIEFEKAIPEEKRNLVKVYDTYLQVKVPGSKGGRDNIYYSESSFKDKFLWLCDEIVKMSSLRAFA
jgi:hypothetical protein